MPIYDIHVCMLHVSSNLATKWNDDDDDEEEEEEGENFGIQTKN